MWEQKQVLVTGTGGFICSHLTEALIKVGAKVRVFIRYNSGDGRGNLNLKKEHGKVVNFRD